MSSATLARDRCRGADRDESARPPPYAPRVREGAAQDDVWAPLPASLPSVDLDGDTAVHVPVAGTVVLLNTSARDVLRLVDGRRSAGEVVAVLAERYGTPASALLDDVRAALLDLAAAGLVREPPSARSGGLVVQALGATFTVVVEEPGLRAELADLLADLRSPPAGPAGAAGLVVVRGTGPWQVSSAAHRAVVTDRDEALRAALAALNLTAVASSPHLAVHAAVLARGARTLVLPGRSGLGKTTLSVALLRDGWQLVSDEALVLPWEGGTRPLPYARPLALSAWSCAELGLPVPTGAERLLTAADVGGTVRTDPGAVTDVVLLRRDAATGPLLRDVARSAALPELFARGFTTAADPGRALRRLRDVLAGAAVRQLDVAGPVASARLLGTS